MTSWKGPRSLRKSALEKATIKTEYAWGREIKEGYEFHEHSWKPAPSTSAPPTGMALTVACSSLPVTTEPSCNEL